MLQGLESVVEGGNIIYMQNTRNPCNILVRKPKLKIPLERPKRRRGINIKTNIRKRV